MKTWVLISGLVFLSLTFGIEVYTYFQQQNLMQVAGNIPAVEALAYIDFALWMLPIMSTLSMIVVILGLVMQKNANINKGISALNDFQIKTKRQKKKK